MPTTVVNLHCYKGPCIKVCRGTPWGNPFTHLQGPTKAQFRVKNRTEAIESYKDWFIDQIDLQKRLPELCGQVLGCYCVPADCHATWLAELADSI